MSGKEPLELDELDLEIIRLLSKDSRLGYTSIANTLAKSPLTIKKHIEELEEKQVFASWGVQLDFERLGYDIIAIIEARIAKGKMLEVEKQLASHPNVFGIYDCTGQYDCLVLARFKNRRELSKVIKELLRTEDIIHTNTHVALNVIKEGADFDAMYKGELANKKKE